MIAIALFAVAAVLYVVASRWREKKVPKDGVLRPDRMTRVLTLSAMAVAFGAILLSSIQMVISVTT
ncbi:MAG: hypothetical protein ABWY93_19435 [Mycobacterium sp.]